MKYLIAILMLAAAASAQTGAAQHLNLYGGQVQVQIVEIHYVNSARVHVAPDENSIVPVIYAVVNGHHAALACFLPSCEAPEKGNYTGTISGNSITLSFTDWRDKTEDQKYVSLGGW